MKKSIIAVATTLTLLFSAVTACDMHSSASTSTQTQATVTDVSFTSSTTPATSKKAENQAQYIITAMYNGELIALDCWDTNHRNTALTSPTVLKWPGKQCRDIELHIVVKVKQVNIVDSDYNVLAKLKVTTLKNGAQVVKFVMKPDLAGTEHTKPDDPSYVLNRDYYFELVAPDGTAYYTSVRYGFND